MLCEEATWLASLHIIVRALPPLRREKHLATCPQSRHNIDKDFSGPIKIRLPQDLTLENSMLSRHDGISEPHVQKWMQIYFFEKYLHVYNEADAIEMIPFDAIKAGHDAPSLRIANTLIQYQLLENIDLVFNLILDY